jgi:hypothetical protein
MSPGGNLSYFPMKVKLQSTFSLSVSSEEGVIISLLDACPDCVVNAHSLRTTGELVLLQSDRAKMCFSIVVLMMTYFGTVQ